ncbi:hypothetical protein AQUCO_02000539v1 [Aquilegia coerulea]|uniref:Uncharacterized protein n=1 Tax=Aquilegia coerulea TaxID=218851 RepID=A0A2G5DI45_AQUCA|nr:hypothetical protein AQUCO_02000539v1 [Aquilegia coerulea]
MVSHENFSLRNLNKQVIYINQKNEKESHSLYLNEKKKKTYLLYLHYQKQHYSKFEHLFQHQLNLGIEEHSFSQNGLSRFLKNESN